MLLNPISTPNLKISRHFSGTINLPLTMIATVIDVDNTKFGGSIAQMGNQLRKFGIKSWHDLGLSHIDFPVEYCLVDNRWVGHGVCRRLATPIQQPLCFPPTEAKKKNYQQWSLSASCIKIQTKQTYMNRARSKGLYFPSRARVSRVRWRARKTGFWSSGQLGILEGGWWTRASHWATRLSCFIGRRSCQIPIRSRWS